MEGGDDPQRRQYEQSGYPTSRGYGQVPRAGPGSELSDRYRQAQMSSIRPPTSAPQTSQALQSQGIAGYGYTQGQPQFTPQLQDTSMQYQADFAHETPRVQQYPQYSSHLMSYNIPQQAPQQAAYEPVQQFQPRQSAAVEVLSNQFGVPQYYPPSESSSAPTLAQQYASAPFQQQMAYQHSAQANRSAVPASYAVGIADYEQPPLPDVLGQQQPEPQEQPDNSGYDAAYSQYLEALRRAFQDIRDGRLVEAGQCLLEISEWLLGHASELGLTKDEQPLHGERIKLWNDFNTCWLGVLQRQKDITQGMLDSGQPPPPPQSILQIEFLERMGRELVRLCDGMERHGLVDYQMGVWEEEIIILTDCLDLLEGEDEDEPEEDSNVLPPGLQPTPR
ncbi:hypothetical protein MMC26_002318 [Xylographa opegraphella]|nr:hypothetical protein [Xylographa opegraphella]